MMSCEFGKLKVKLRMLSTCDTALLTQVCEKRPVSQRSQFDFQHSRFATHFQLWWYHKVHEKVLFYIETHVSCSQTGQAGG